jgi:nitronate monooxygenase
LALGADGVNMGTRFCATEEAPIHENIKRFIVENDERATNLIFRSLRNTGRVAKNTVSDNVVEILKNTGATFSDVAHLVKGCDGREALKTGDIEAGLIWGGQVQGLINDIPSCKELIDQMIGDAREIILSKLTSFVK